MLPRLGDARGLAGLKKNIAIKETSQVTNRPPALHARLYSGKM